MTAPSTVPAPAVDLPEIDGGAVRITKAAPANETRIIVAWVVEDGREIPITVPQILPGNLIFNALRVYRRAGTRAMITWMVEEALGDDQCALLSNCDGMTPADFKNLLEKVGKLYEGQVDELLGN